MAHVHTLLKKKKKKKKIIIHRYSPLLKASLKQALSALIVSTVCLPSSRILTAGLSCSVEGKCPMARVMQGR